MDDDLVGYLLGSLDDAEREAVEARLQASPAARQALTLLKRAMAPLAADHDDVPPADLANRTLAKIAAQAGRDLPRAPGIAREAAGAGWWRRADVVVGAGLAVLTLALLAPVLFRGHRQRGAIECQENLRQFFVALATYRDQHGAYPDLTREAPRNVAGLVVPILADAGVLPASFSVRCPAVGSPLGCTTSLGSLRELSEDEFRVQAPNLALGYAFALGYRDPAGDYHAPWHVPGCAWPILADRPPSEGSPGNSMNHDGSGQNVLFLDGHFRFVPGRTVGDPDDDIFLNRANCVAAGIGAQDIVLGYSAALP